MDKLAGYRTYITAAAGIAVTALAAAGVLDHGTANTLLALLGFSGLAALRAAK